MMKSVKLALVETGKNFDVLSPRSSATDPRDRILRQRLSEVRLNGRFQLNTVEHLRRFGLIVFNFRPAGIRN